jgi:radical SAM protein with 4Fe4S-binding SPASM domain
LKTPKRISTGPDEISNRGGYLWYSQNVKKPCYQPSMKSIVDWDGSVYVCCEDWNKQVSFGNVYKQSFSSIWLSQELHDIRMRLHNGKRTFSACKNCNFLPENSRNERESAEIWQNYK